MGMELDLKAHRFVLSSERTIRIPGRRFVALERASQRLIAKATAGKTKTESKLPPSSAASTAGDIRPA